MQPKADPGLGKQIADRPAPCIIERLEGVWGDVGLCVDDADIILRRPADAVLERQSPAKVDAYPVFQSHAGHLFLPQVS